MLPFGFPSELKPAKGPPGRVAVTMAVAMSGTNPPNHPFPRWYGTDSDGYRILAGKNSTRNAAIGPYTAVTYTTWMNTSRINGIRSGLAPAGMTLPSASKAGWEKAFIA